MELRDARNLIYCGVLFRRKNAKISSEKISEKISEHVKSDSKEKEIIQSGVELYDLLMQADQLIQTENIAEGGKLYNRFLEENETALNKYFPDSKEDGLIKTDAIADIPRTLSLLSATLRMKLI